jgi:iron complex outermembrane receptor protein
MRNSNRRRGLLAGLGGVSAAALLAGGACAQDQAAETTQVDAVVVTGSFLRNIKQEDVASPVVSVDQKALTKTGVVSIGDLLRYVPQNIGSMGGVQDLAKGGQDSKDTRSANLRGLGSGATLVLMNGRRVVKSDGYVNLNSLTPPIAVARVETVLDGASATYGADAVAGVFNIITDGRFEGFKTSAQYTYIEDSPAWQVQAMWGAKGDRSRLVASASYTDIERLQNSDRAVTNIFNASSGAGANPGAFTLTARPRTAGGGDVVINGVNYSTLYDTYKNAAGTLAVVDPNCGSAETKSVFTPSASGPGYAIGSCAFSFQAQNPIRGASQSGLIHVEGEYDLTDQHTLFLESAIYHQDSQRYGVPSYAQNHNGATPPIVPASNPYNPFGVAVYYVGRPIGSQGLAGLNYNVQRNEANQFHNVVGAKGPVFGDWNYAATLTSSWSSNVFRDHDTDMNLFQAALNGYGGQNCNYRWNGAGVGAVAGQGNCYYLSPFAKDNTTNNPAVLFNIQSEVFTRTVRDMEIADLVIDGTLGKLRLPAGDISGAVGLQWRREGESIHYSDLLRSGYAAFGGPSVDRDADRTIKSVFTEWNLPIVDGMNLDLAVRHEDYGGFKTTNPKASLIWRPNDSLSLRASASTAFQAPGLENATNGPISNNVVNITDPVLGTTNFRTVTTIGNADLKPQTSKVHNLGVTWLPVRRASLSLDWWTFKYDNQIAVQNGQAVINAAPNGPQVVRDQSGVAQTIYVTSYNAKSGTQTSGLDIAASWSFDVGDSIFTLRDNLSYLLKYDIDTGSLVYDGVGRRNNTTTSPSTAAAAPKYRNLSSVDWSMGPHFASATVRYVSGVMDDYAIAITATTAARVKSWTVLDLQYAYAFGQDERYRVTVGAINVFDRAAPSAKYTGYLSSVADPFGRQSYIRLDARF